MSKIIDLEVLGNFKERQDAVNEDKFLKRSNVTADGNEVKITTTEADSDQGISEVSYTALTTDSSLSASKVTGVLDISNIPPSAQERVIIVADATARKALTTDDVQKGDVVKETDTGLMYFVVDDTKLDQDAGYTAFAAGIASSADTVKLTPTRADSYYALVFADACAISSATTKGLVVASHSSTSSHCPIRVNPGIDNSTSQGTATLSLGNNINNGTAYNKQGRIALYGTNTGYTIIQPGYNSTSSVTLTLPSSTGTIALTSSNITGSSASCTGNAATATSAAACTGNSATATTATNANKAKLTHTVGNTEYPLVFGSSFVITDAQQALRIGTPTATATNCALRCKAYCAAANTQGEAYISLGNNIAKASANNSRGSIYLYGTNAYSTRIIPSDTSANIALTLPSATGTIALTSSNITGSSASCTGNAATATTASACSGNAATATLATGSTNIRVTDTDSNTWYPLIFSSGSAASTNYAARVDSDSVLVNPGTSPAANTQGNCYLQLGNAKAKATAGNKMGRIRLYGSNTSYNEIISGAGTSACTITLPAKTGTVALTSDIPAIPAFNNIYTGFGVLVKSDENKITGYGHATITYVGTDKVRIECTIRITANSSTAEYSLYGISAGQVKSVTGFPSNITPISYAGYWDCPSVNISGLNLFGGGTTFVSQSSNKYWQFGRYYTTGGAFGGWPANIWGVSTIDGNGGTVLHCVCYGSI